MNRIQKRKTAWQYYWKHKLVKYLVNLLLNKINSIWSENLFKLNIIFAIIKWKIKIEIISTFK